MSDPAELEARVQELEIRFTEQQRLIEELSDALFAQQRALDGLTKAIERLRDRLAAEPGLVEAGADDKPPHY